MIYTRPFMNKNVPMKTIHTTELFDAWFYGLRDKQGKARIEARLRPRLPHLPATAV